MKKISTVKNCIIAQDNDGSYSVFTKDEFSFGEGCRYPEYDGIQSLEEAKDLARYL